MADPSVVGGAWWGFDLTARVVYVTPDGATVDAPGAALRAHSELGVLATSEPVILFDYDGDGAAEFLLLHREDAYEESHQRRYEFLTARDGAVRGFSAPVSTLVGVTDADGDGRPDLVLDSAYGLSEPCGYAGIIDPGPRQLAHSLPGGAFALGDAVAVEFARQRCDAASPTLLRPDESSSSLNGAQTALAIACASLRGATPPELVARVRAEYARLPASVVERSECTPLASIEEVAGTRAPFTVREPCAVR